MKTLATITATFLLGVLAHVSPALAADAPVKQIHLDQYNGYFAAQETLAGLTAGKYEFIVTNKAGKLAGFQLQNFRTRETLDMFPLEPGETKSTIVEVTTDGVRYRCPINPTPWYDVDGVQAAAK